MPLSTEEVAKKVGVTRVTLERWLAHGKVAAPKAIRIGRGTFRQWTARDIERIRKYKRKKYWKGQGRPRKKK